MRRISGVSAVLGVALLAGVVSVALVVPRVRATSAPGAAPLQAGGANQPCGVGWSVVSSPNVGSYHNELLGVAAIGPRDAWAVGVWQDSGKAVQPLAEHWDGRVWRVAAVPTPSAGNGKLTAVAAVSPSDVWAVGYYFPAFATQATLVEHWDGVRWSTVASANAAGEQSSSLASVAAISPTDVWAVGAANSPSLVPLLEHWNGRQWSIVPSAPSGAMQYSFNAVAATAADDVWAMGDAYDGSSATHLPLAEHWDGRTWQVVSNGISGASGPFAAVASATHGDVWAVGASDARSGAPLMAHWDGQRWRMVAASASAAGGWFDAVSIAPHTQRAWAAGSILAAKGQIHALVNVWSGAEWRLSASPSPDAVTYLRAVSAVSPNDVWAVGDDLYATLIEHYHAPARAFGCRT